MAMGSPGGEIFGEDVIDEKLARKLCFGGVGRKYRGVAWRIIFQVVGLRRRTHEEEVEERHQKYIGMTKSMGSFCRKDPEICCMTARAGGGDCRRSGEECYRPLLPKKILHQIDIDIKRIDLGYRMYSGRDISYMYYRVLWLIAYRRPLLGYIQGMADILVPFVLVFSQENIERAESNAYFCYSRLLDETQHNMIELQAGMIRGLDLVLQIVDPDLHRFLKGIGLEMHMFAFRWFNCFFAREFRIPVLLKILDTIFASDSINESLLYFGAALLMRFKPVLVESDFAHNILFLQGIYEREWEEAEIELVLSSAKFYRKVTSGQLSWSQA